MIDTVKQPLSELEQLRQENKRLRSSMVDVLKLTYRVWSEEDAAAVVKDYHLLTETMNMVELTIQRSLDFGKADD